MNSVLSGLPDKRRRRTNAQIEQLQRQIYSVMVADNPVSVRNVFYRMTDPRLPEPVEKSERGYAQVQHLCTKMRRAGELPYGWFVDVTRYGYHVNTFSSAADFVLSMQGHYRADLWRDAAVRCEVWVESRSIAGMIMGVCEDNAVSLFPCGGFPSLTFVYESAEIHNQSGDDRPLQIIYIGDYDPAGVLIWDDLQSKLRQHLADDIELRFTRLGINEDQIAIYNLPTKPRKAGDKRVKHIDCTVEAEALPARVLRELVRESIEVLLPPGALFAAQVAEQSERGHLTRMAQLLRPEARP